MEKDLNFLGLGISMGQSHAGPAKAHLNILQYTNAIKTLGLRFLRQHSIIEEKSNYLKFFAAEHLETADLSIYEKAFYLSRYFLEKKEPSLNWGGDHSAAISTVAAFCSQHPNGYVLWIDAHADINLPSSSLTGHLHGMPVAVLTNLENVGKNHFPWIKNFLDPKRIIYVGIRDLDPFEEKILKDLNIKSYSMADIQRQGMSQVAQEIMSITLNYPLHISFDIDSVSPEYAPATGLHVPDGLSPQDLFTFGQILSHHSKITSMDVVEINPTIGSKEEIFKTNLIALSFVKWIFSHNNKIWRNLPYDNRRTGEKFYSIEMEKSLQI